MSISLVTAVSTLVFMSGCGNEASITEAINTDKSVEISVLSDIQTVQEFTEDAVDWYMYPYYKERSVGNTKKVN